MGNPKSQKSLTEQKEEIQENLTKNREESEALSFQEAVSQDGVGRVLITTFIIGGIIGVIANPAQPVTGFLGIGFVFSGIAWLFGTESGARFREEVKDNMEEAQQEQQFSSSKPKVVCSNCGWQNPKGNNYCHDCGTKLGTNE